ncbi:glycosyltransferase family 4 protein [Neomoorella humiferrea]|uniref:Alpha-D-kanosaminyltransferase n=1 Tax=Neomoorella humiferrea TaxID=676965 RepID=A0A2T0ANS9_9FIRM|nr:glycosyltransferase family 4 protein [Moorella humiferrea]PRR70679.1 Alpha-D-kanosaminyltransferase [Moorella humiferrea]
MQPSCLQRVLICRSNPVAPDPRVEKIAQALCQAGYEVLVLAWDRTGQLPREEWQQGYHIVRFSHPASYGLGLKNIFHILRWQTFLLRFFIRNRQGIRICHACDFDTLLPCLFSKVFRGNRVIYDVFDFYADSRRTIPGFMRKLLYMFELKALNHADAVILVDEARRKQIARGKPRHVTIVYNSPPDILDALRFNVSPIRRAELYLAYVGLLQVERGLLEILEVLTRHPEWHLDLAGFGGGDEERILGLARLLSNVTWHGRVPYKQALELSYAADVLFATYDPAIPNHRYSSPNKVFEAMMLAKPVVVARGTGIDRLVEEVNCGLVVVYGDVAALEAALIRLARDPALRQRLGENGRRAYEEKYSWNLMRERLLALYRKISI